MCNGCPDDKQEENTEENEYSQVHPPIECAETSLRLLRVKGDFTVFPAVHYSAEDIGCALEEAALQQELGLSQGSQLNIRAIEQAFLVHLFRYSRQRGRAVGVRSRS